MENLAQELASITQNGLMTVFVIVVVLDIITGYAKAFITKTFTSREATDGLIRQAVRMLVFFATSFALHALSNEPTPTIDGLVALLQSAFIIAYIRSLYENFKEMDLKFFEQLGDK